MIRRVAFFGIVWAYIWIVSRYAIATPAWQVPDEPAHYNYVRFVAEQGAIPVLNFGDYDQAYLESIKAQKFPATMSIDKIRYESHQPPLYYLSMMPFYITGEAAALPVRLLGLRLSSALWGVLLLAMTFRLTQEAFAGGSNAIAGRWQLHEIAPTIAVSGTTRKAPAQGIALAKDSSATVITDSLPLLATAFVAFIPQHLAMLAGVENDALADVLLAASALCLLRVLRFAASGEPAERRTWWGVGLMLGLGLVTKTTTYVSAGLVAVSLLWLWRNGQDFRRSLSYAIPPLVCALAIAAIWFARDAAIYGPLDWLGLARHNAVVAGQPETLQLYGSYFVAATYYFLIMFRSFWGQFGWMGVPLDNRTYNILFGFTVFVLVGLAMFLGRMRRAASAAASKLDGARLALLGAWIAFTFIATAGYSLEFFQAQGRYLFPALPAIAVFFALGLHGWSIAGETMFRRMGVGQVVIERIILVGCIGGLLALDYYSLVRFLIPGLTGN